MAASPMYSAAQECDVVLLRLREDYEQAVLDLFEADQEAKEVRPALEVVGHTPDFLDNMRLPVHRWFRYGAGFSAEWVKSGARLGAYAKKGPAIPGPAAQRRFPRKGLD